ncbi:MAG TPA: serine--tRNA ligase [Bacteroidia bacterium]|nr:serine--tRNA ligase [Bacteroidia bacterium]
MLQLNYIREKSEDVISRLAIKNFDAKNLVQQVLTLDVDRRKIQTELDTLNSEANTLAKQIGDLFKAGKQAEANELKNKTVALKESVKKLEGLLYSIEEELNKVLVLLPNLPSAKVPKGKTPADNENIFSEGELPKLPATAKPHWELAQQYNLIDFELGVKLTGAGFPVYKGKGAKLQRALINYFLDQATSIGYLEIEPPILINEASGFGTGQLPDKEGQMYHVAGDNLFLIPTAEVPITNIYRDVILKAEELPVKNCGYTPCFRREAGSYGKDVRGLNRLHQFDKVEIVQIAHPEKSYDTLEEMKNYVGSLLKKLELPYRILKLCGGDMSFGSALTYDFETYSAAQQKWLEVSSVSNFETFQSNRSKIRFRDTNGKPQLAHTLNGSALALPRIVATMLENNQTEKGIRIPKVLVPYTGFEIIN